MLVPQLPQKGGLTRSKRKPSSASLCSLSPGPSTPSGSCGDLVRLNAAATIQRAWRRKVRSKKRAAVVSLASPPKSEAQEAEAEAEESVGRKASPRMDPQVVFTIALAVSLALVDGLLNEQASLCTESAHSAGQCSTGVREVTTLLAEDEEVHELVDNVAAVEASTAAEAALASGAGRAASGASALTRVAFSVSLRWALLKLSDADGLESFLSAELGPYAAALTLGTLSATAARALTQALQQRVSGAAAVPPPPPPPPLPARPRRRRPRTPHVDEEPPGLAQSLATAAISAAAQAAVASELQGVLHGAANAAASDVALLLAGGIGGAAAGLAARLVDATLRRAREALREHLREREGAATTLLAAADGLMFLALEAAVVHASR